MKSFNQLMLGPKLLLLFLGAGVLPLIAVVAILISRSNSAMERGAELSEEALRNQVSGRLVAITEIKRSDIERYFSS